MLRAFVSTVLAAGSIMSVSALALADETVVEKRTYEEQRHEVQVVPAVKERVIEERTVVKEPPPVRTRTETVTTKTTRDDDNDNDDDDNDND